MMMTADALRALSPDEMIYRLLSLHHEVEQLKKMVYGSRSERFIPDQSPAVQLSLLPVPEPAPAASPAQPPALVSYQRKEKKEQVQHVHPGRMTFPAHLPRLREVLEPEGLTEDHRKIGEEVTQELEYRPGSLYVRELVRPKYAAPGGGVIIAPLPLRPIHKGMAGPALLAQVAVDKYVDALPLYRQTERFKRMGIELSSSTLSDWISGTCTLLEPLLAYFEGLVQQSPYLCVDETPIKVLDRDKKGTTHKGYMWCYYSPPLEMVLFDYQPSRDGTSMRETLKGYQGTIQCDGYATYETVWAQDPAVTLIHCWAHVRRKFFEAASSSAVLSDEAMTFIGALYQIERCKGSRHEPRPGSGHAPGKSPAHSYPV